MALCTLSKALAPFDNPRLYFKCGIGMWRWFKWCSIFLVKRFGKCCRIYARLLLIQCSPKSLPEKCVLNKLPLSIMPSKCHKKWITWRAKSENVRHFSSFCTPPCALLQFTDSKLQGQTNI